MSGDSAKDKNAVEIVATVQHRRRWSVSEKIRMEPSEWKAFQKKIVSLLLSGGQSNLWGSVNKGKISVF